MRSAASNPAAACSPGTPQKVIPVGSPALQYGDCRFVKSDPFATTSPSASSWKYASPFDVLAAGTSRPVVGQVLVREEEAEVVQVVEAVVPHPALPRTPSVRWNPPAPTGWYPQWRATSLTLPQAGPGGFSLLKDSSFGPAVFV